MIYNLQNKDDLSRFNYQCDILKSKNVFVELQEHKITYSSQQNRARWLYLSQCAEILNERGETLNPVGTKLEVPFSKDVLYVNYWVTLRGYMYPEHKGKLTTKEFAGLVEMIMMLMAKVFNISIPFPSYEND